MARRVRLTRVETWMFAHRPLPLGFMIATLAPLGPVWLLSCSLCRGRSWPCWLQDPHIVNLFLRASAKGHYWGLYSILWRLELWFLVQIYGHLHCITRPFHFKTHVPIGTRGAGVGVAQRVSVPQISFRRKLFPSPAAVRWRAYGSPGSLDPR